MSSGARAARPTRPSNQDLEALLRPHSIAIVGASERDSFGQRLLWSVRSGRYAGHVYPINPRYETLAGIACFPDLKSVPEAPDCAAFAVSDEQIEAALADAAAAGVRAAVIFGRAYEKYSPGTLSRIDRLAAIACDANMAICGNNCMGFINFVDGLKVSGNPPPIPEKAGVVGFVSHSGSTWSGLIGNQRDLLFNFAVSAGQEIATTMAEYIRFLLDRPETRVIGCIMEAVRDPVAFLEAIEHADAKGIPVVVLKLGRSERGRELALAHSGALTGSASVYKAVFERRNVVSTETPDEFADTLELLSSPRRPPIPNIGVVTDSGGERELIVDLASDIRAPLAELEPPTQAALLEVLDPGMLPVNPVDSYGDGRMLLRECLSVVAKDPQVGIVALATNLVHGRPYLYGSTAAIEAVFNETEKPALVFGNLHSTVSREEASRLRGLGIPVLMGTGTALLAMKHLGDWQSRRERRDYNPPQMLHPPSGLDVLERAIASAGGAAVPPELSSQILEVFGIEVPASRFVDDQTSAAEAAAELGFPVVLKTATPSILHKTESGGVVVGLHDRAAVKAAYDRIVSTCGPRAQVQAQVPAGVEVLLGMTTDPTFGPMMTIALGGVLTELLQDAVTVEPPVSAAMAHDLLTRLKGYPLLQGYRGRPGADVQALALTIERFSFLCASLAHALEAIDVNPVLAGPAGATAVDALFLVKPNHSKEAAA
jgi:acyl-CoA synthetase (NDP forming)